MQGDIDMAYKNLPFVQIMEIMAQGLLERKQRM